MDRKLFYLILPLFGISANASFDICNSSDEKITINMAYKNKDERAYYMQPQLSLDSGDCDTLLDESIQDRDVLLNIKAHSYQAIGHIPLCEDKKCSELKYYFPVKTGNGSEYFYIHNKKTSFREYCEDEYNSAEQDNAIKAIIEKLGASNCEDAGIKLEQKSELDLSNSKIKDLSFLSTHKNIRKLDLSGNSITSIRFLQGFKSLEELNLSYNQIKSVKSLQKSFKLKALNLSNNKITRLPNMRFLRNLHSLKLSGNYIEELTPLSRLTNLVDLDISKNSFYDISSISNLAKIENLNMSNNPLLSDISAIKNLSQLEVLTFNNSAVEDISVLENLNDLKVLSLANTYVNSFKSLSSLKELKVLSLANNKILDFKPLNSLSRLESLDLYNTELKSLDEISKLTKLRYLDVRQNELAGAELFTSFKNLNAIEIDETVVIAEKCLTNGSHSKATHKYCGVTNRIMKSWPCSGKLENDPLTSSYVCEKVAPLVEKYNCDINSFKNAVFGMSITDIATMVSPPFLEEFSGKRPHENCEKAFEEAFNSTTRRITYDRGIATGSFLCLNTMRNDILDEKNLLTRNTMWKRCDAMTASDGGPNSSRGQAMERNCSSNPVCDPKPIEIKF